MKKEISRVDNKKRRFVFFISEVAFGISIIEVYENKYDSRPIGVNVNDKIRKIEDNNNNLNNM